ncbi:hypothetical protein HYPSUDRAFT_203732 [Hypholoma sublateritium FD-334 SS-4]|uniref:Uncharacterized protein n=1 Tax=Hypholoma sublateritium (strain FD-334 SS-4) TaxID=945553 RepID=A0A0D2NV47_HYPSF|nr:hypothetical protein HYPSUDRAFT_203732 [Hypholoma sublateritium FD-334 SS-4]
MRAGAVPVSAAAGGRTSALTATGRRRRVAGPHNAAAISMCGVYSLARCAAPPWARAAYRGATLLAGLEPGAASDLGYAMLVRAFVHGEPRGMDMRWGALNAGERGRHTSSRMNRGAERCISIVHLLVHDIRSINNLSPLPRGFPAPAHRRSRPPPLPPATAPAVRQAFTPVRRHSRLIYVAASYASMLRAPPLPRLLPLMRAALARRACH